MEKNLEYLELRKRVHQSAAVLVASATVTAVATGFMVWHTISVILS
ncbi:MAG: hypothetical protein FWF59_00660 [Turicibacter sp.]|nr:hypothetical protein [Turicibacter sp.]